MPAIRCALGVLLRGLRHEPVSRLGEETVELGGADPVRERRDLGIHERRRLGGEAEGG